MVSFQTQQPSRQRSAAASALQRRGTRLPHLPGNKEALLRNSGLSEDKWTPLEAPGPPGGGVSGASWPPASSSASQFPLLLLSGPWPLPATSQLVALRVPDVAFSISSASSFKIPGKEVSSPFTPLGPHH